MLVEVEINPGNFSDKVRAMEELQQKFVHSVERILGIRTPVKIVPPNTIPRSEGKAKRVLDLRNEKKS